MKGEKNKKSVVQANQKEGRNYNAVRILTSKKKFGFVSTPIYIAVKYSYKVRQKTTLTWENPILRSY